MQLEGARGTPTFLAKPISRNQMGRQIIFVTSYVTGKTGLYSQGCQDAEAVFYSSSLYFRALPRKGRALPLVLIYVVQISLKGF
jgi:hypothetical protein